MFPPGFEPGTFRVLGERDNHYTTETAWEWKPTSSIIIEQKIVEKTENNF